MHLGYNPNRELPIVAKIKSDVSKFNDKNAIVKRIKELDREKKFEEDIERFIWNDKDEKDIEQIQSNSIISFDQKPESAKPQIIDPKPESAKSVKAKINIKPKFNFKPPDLNKKMLFKPLASLQKLSEERSSSFLSQLVDNNSSVMSESRSISVDLEFHDQLSIITDREQLSMITDQDQNY